MFKITRTMAEGKPRFEVAHFVTWDRQPTPTQKYFSAEPEAWADAFGRAAKLALILGRPEVVQVADGRKFHVQAEPV